MTDITAQPPRGRIYRAHSSGISYRQRVLHAEAGLAWLDCGEFFLPAGARSHAFLFPERECLLAMWKGTAAVSTSKGEFLLAHYDMLYLPRGCAFALASTGTDPATLVLFSAPAANPHPVQHARFSEVARNEQRIRRLKGKDVFLMFDVSEPAEKLVAGYTFFQPFQRSWPPHNHTDQEEIYFFTKGRGAMEVYESPETLCFVAEVAEGDLVTIPFLHYHPVFSQQEPLEFIWCIAGARYWVGDRAPQFMQGASEAITT